MNSPNIKLTLRVLEEELGDAPRAPLLGVAEATGLVFAHVTRLAASPDDAEQALDHLIAIAAAAVRAAAALSGEEE
jgi:hypothetical protein